MDAVNFIYNNTSNTPRPQPQPRVDLCPPETQALYDSMEWEIEEWQFPEIGPYVAKQREPLNVTQFNLSKIQLSIEKITAITQKVIQALSEKRKNLNCGTKIDLEQDVRRLNISTWVSQDSKNREVLEKSLSEIEGAKIETQAGKTYIICTRIISSAQREFEKVTAEKAAKEAAEKEEGAKREVEIAKNAAMERQKFVEKLHSQGKDAIVKFLSEQRVEKILTLPEFYQLFKENLADFLNGRKEEFVREYIRIEFERMRAVENAHMDSVFTVTKEFHKALQLLTTLDLSSLVDCNWKKLAFIKQSQQSIQHIHSIHLGKIQDSCVALVKMLPRTVQEVYVEFESENVFNSNIFSICQHFSTLKKLHIDGVLGDLKDHIRYDLPDTLEEFYVNIEGNGLKMSDIELLSQKPKLRKLEIIQATIVPDKVAEMEKMLPEQELATKLPKTQVRCRVFLVKPRVEPEPHFYKRGVGFISSLTGRKGEKPSLDTDDLSKGFGKLSVSEKQESKKSD